MPGGELAAANRAVQGSNTVTEVAGPGLAGLLVQAVGPPLAMLVDALSYLASALGVLLGRRPAEREPTASDGGAEEEEAAEPTGVAQGLKVLFGNPYLRALTVHAAAYNLAEQVVSINLMLWAVQSQGVTPGAYGLALSAGGVGALLGTLTALRLADRLGFGRAFAVSLLLSCFAPLLLAILPLHSVALAAIIGGVMLATGIGLGNANVYSLDPAPDRHPALAARPVRWRLPSGDVRVHPDRQCPRRGGRRAGRHPDRCAGRGGGSGPVRTADVHPADPYPPRSAGRGGGVTEKESEGGWRAGFRIGVTLAFATAALGVSFGAYAALAGWPAIASILMSMVVFSGSAQFAYITATADGGSILLGLGAAALMNLRFVPMAAASARSLHGGRLRRAVEGQAVVDGSWVAAQRADGTTDREKMIAATLVQGAAWISGTAVGALLVPSADLLYRLGLDIVFPCFFLLLLMESMRSRPSDRWVALVAAAIAGLALIAVPVGVALLLSAAASLVVLIPRRRAS